MRPEGKGWKQRRTAWGKQGGRRRPEAGRPVGPETDVKPFQGWPPIGHRRVWHWALAILRGFHGYPLNYALIWLEDGTVRQKCVRSGTKH
jgi:hypothetical protein